MGNHDERAPYARGLFGSDDDGCQDRAYDVGGLRVLALDTSVPGYHHGDLTDDQLGWLRRPARHPGRARHAARDAPPADPGADAARGRDHRAARPAPARRGGRRHRRPGDPRRPLPLHVVVDLRRHPGLGRVRQLLHQRPGAAGPADLRRRRPPGDDDAAPLRRPGRPHRRAAAGGAGGQRLPRPTSSPSSRRSASRSGARSSPARTRSSTRDDGARRTPAATVDPDRHVTAISTPTAKPSASSHSSVGPAASCSFVPCPLLSPGQDVAVLHHHVDRRAAATGPAPRRPRRSRRRRRCRGTGR